MPFLVLSLLRDVPIDVSIGKCLTEAKHNLLNGDLETEYEIYI